MPDSFDANGLQVATLPEVVTSLGSALKGVYGSDINIDQNSQDGQTLNIIAQVAIDLRELLSEINAGFNPDIAAGVILDQRVAINNITRQGGTFTIVPIDITVSQTVALAGLDAAANDVDGVGYTVEDDAGNQFILLDTTNVLAGTTTLDFRAKQIGAVATTVGTITTPSTIVLGVTAVNNSAAPVQIGQDEETDSQLRLRRAQSVALGSFGYLNGMLGSILALTGVTDAVLYENVTDTVDANGIPAHGTWLVVDGGANTDIGNTIYAKKSYGSNLKGSVVVPILRANGQTFNAKFDRPTARNLWIRFNLKKLTSASTFNTAGIRAYMVANTDYNIGQPAETSSLTAAAAEAIAATGGGGVPLDLAISSDGVTYTDYLPVPTLDSLWTLDASRITITVVDAS